MLTATRYHDISVGHRVHEHNSKCRHLHGHNYRIHFTIAGEAENPDMVMDFGIIKEVFCYWLEENWDHRFLIYEKDPLAQPLLELDKNVLIVPFNPTAENMAEFLVEKLGPYLLHKEERPEWSALRLIRVTVEETRKCSATYEVKNV